MCFHGRDLQDPHRLTRCTSAAQGLRHAPCAWTSQMTAAQHETSLPFGHGKRSSTQRRKLTASESQNCTATSFTLLQQCETWFGALLVSGARADPTASSKASSTGLLPHVKQRRGHRLRFLDEWTRFGSLRLRDAT